MGHGRMSRENKLTPKQSLFCKEYLVDLNGAGAARRAGYAVKHADHMALNLIQKPQVKAEIGRLMEQRAKAVNMDAQALLGRLIDEANADVADLYEDDGTLKPVRKWPAIWRKGLVAGIEFETMRAKDDEAPAVTITKVKLSDRVRRLELIGKHVGVGAFKEKVEHSVSDPLADLFRQISGNTIKPKEG
jgi:phage terminase small subunit